MRRWISPSPMNYFATALKKEWLRVFGKTTAMNPWYVHQDTCSGSLRCLRCCLPPLRSLKNRSKETLDFWTGLLLWELSGFPLLSGDMATWKSPYLSPKSLRPEAIPSYQGRVVGGNAFLIRPKPVRPHLDRLSLCRKFCSSSSSYQWEFSLWGSWNPGQEGYGANRQTVLGHRKQRGEEKEPEMLFVSP